MEDLHKLVQHLSLHDFTLIGISMGGGEDEGIFTLILDYALYPNRKFVH